MQIFYMLGGEGKIPYVFCFCTYFLKASLIPKQGKENTVANIVILKSDSWNCFLMQVTGIFFVFLHASFIQKNVSLS